MMDHLIKMNKWQPYRQTSGGRFFQKEIEIHFSSREQFLWQLKCHSFIIGVAGSHEERDVQGI